MQVKNRLLISASIILLFDIIFPVSASKYVEDASPEEVEDEGADRLKGDTAPASHRVTSARAYTADRNSKLGGFRYYGTGSKSGNSFAPTSVHKSTSLDTLNYFVTSKGNSKAKDMEAAGSGMNGNSDGNYLTVYEPPRDTAEGNNNYMMMDNGSNNGMGAGMMGTGNMALEETFGNMMAETGHGGGYGHGGGGKGCNSALGLLGVLGLAAYLQNVLRNMNGTGGRRKREVGFDDPFDTETTLDKVRTGMAHLDWYLLPLNETSKDVKLDKRTYNIVMQDVFPLLSAVAHARDGLIPIHCTHSSVCLANQVLVRDLGNMGHSIGIRISSAIAKLLARLTKDERAEQIRMISKAGKMGRNGRNCLKVFPTCNRLRKLPIYNIPPVTENHSESDSIQSAS